MTSILNEFIIFLMLINSSHSHFDVSTIEKSAGDNWALRNANLKKLIRNLEAYYREELGKGVSFASVDVGAISKEKVRVT